MDEWVVIPEARELYAVVTDFASNPNASCYWGLVLAWRVPPEGGWAVPCIATYDDEEGFTDPYLTPSGHWVTVYTDPEVAQRHHVRKSEALSREVAVRMDDDS
jgi:hypothetical protein